MCMCIDHVVNRWLACCREAASENESSSSDSSSSSSDDDEDLQAASEAPTDSFVYVWGQQSCLGESTINVLYQNGFIDRNKLKLLDKKIIKKMKGLNLAERRMLRNSVEQLKLEETFISSWCKDQGMSNEVLNALIKHEVKNEKHISLLSRRMILSFTLSHIDQVHLLEAVSAIKNKSVD